MKKLVLFSGLIALLSVLLTVSVFAEAIAWPGDGDITVPELSFMKNSSGLDFHEGKLYTVDNGDGAVFVLDVDKAGNLSFAEGFENGVSIAFNEKDYSNVPDAEGISIDENGFAYIAAERANGGSSCNTVLKVDLSKTPDSDNIIQADTDWYLNDYLPEVGSNKGIEAVEWVSFGDIEGKIIDENTNEPFNSENYPDSDSKGIVFVALEANGHVYGFVCNSDASVVRICDIASGFEGAMALDYDKYEGVLWVVTDDNFSNMAVKMTFNGTKSPDLQQIEPPEELDVTKNNEGFAIADHSYTVAGRRPVYRITDGSSKALKVGSVYCSYEAHECLAFEWVILKEPSCANGYKEKRCIECGAVVDSEVIASLYGHNNNSQVVYGIRTNTYGQKELYCKECELVIDIDSSNINLIFEDTPYGSWYGDAVGYIYTMGYMGSTSTSKYTFEPKTNTTRAMFVTILGRVYGIDPEEYKDYNFTFGDVKPGKWYTPYVVWASEKGIVMGYTNGNFGTNDPITREQIVSVLFRGATPPFTYNDKVLDVYTDANKISSYAREPFAWAVDNNIVRGTSATKLSPKKNATRAEIAQLILNYIDSGMAF